MRTFDEAVDVWLRRNAAWYPDGDWTLDRVEVKYQPGGANDTGTYWDGALTIDFVVSKISHTGQRHTRRRPGALIIDDKLVDFMRELVAIGQESEEAK